MFYRGLESNSGKRTYIYARKAYTLHRAEMMQMLGLGPTKEEEAAAAAKAAAAEEAAADLLAEETQVGKISQCGA
jgi:hypothetical protein